MLTLLSAEEEAVEEIDSSTIIARTSTGQRTIPAHAEVHAELRECGVDVLALVLASLTTSTLSHEPTLLPMRF